VLQEKKTIKMEESSPAPEPSNESLDEEEEE
jgi:hypothetical protein